MIYSVIGFFRKTSYNIFYKILRLISSLISKDSKSIVFYPHAGAYIDRYSIFNYKSDSSLSFAHYILKNSSTKYKFYIACDPEEIDELNEQWKRKKLNDIKIVFFHRGSGASRERTFKEKFKVFQIISRSRYIFTSNMLTLQYICRNQELVYLGYYSCNFKNDYIPQYQTNHDIFRHNYKWLVSSSLLFSQINSTVYGMPLEKFVITGMPRTDELLIDDNLYPFKDRLSEKVGYNVEHTILFVPTHRDYEQNIDELRNLMGFEMNKVKWESFLMNSKTVIVAKLHSKQNKDIISHYLPNGIVIITPNLNYGLCELMQWSDALICDYSSAYFDYLLLNKPIIFNFYDFEIYKETRGFAFDPLKEIIAGDIVVDENSLMSSIESVIRGEDNHISKRNYIKNLVFKYDDINNSRRIMDLLGLS